ncbi:MAG: PIN domain-containing protein [Candidatus Brockarchaeota archaeon]|nr:PIN domain-containing protein [Candidatus Brockarchaeota archaeon]
MAYPEGVLDVSILIPACFENPLKEYSIAFLSEVLTQKKRAALPVPAVLGTYHITTRYLRVPKMAVKKVLEGILRSGSPALYPHITPQIALDGLDYAAAYDIESWDGYLIALTRSLGTTVIYSLDQELSKVKEIIVANPFPEDKVKQYHEFIDAKLREG